MEKYVPDVYKESIYKVNYKKLYELGIRFLMFDLDNTIAPFNVKECTDETKRLFAMLQKKGMKTIIFSNSPKSRIEPFAKELDIEFVSCARKPNSKKFLSTLKKYHFNVNEAAIIGDQLYTDIEGGNNVGILTVLVDPVSSYDPIWTKFARRMERKLKAKMRDKGLFKGRYYDEKV